VTLLASIPSPSQGVWNLGPIPVRAYALCILAGIFVAIWLGNKRWIARGGRAGAVADIAIWAVPFGIVGGRIYHVITDWQIYFTDGGKDPIDALKIWDGGLGIWGAVVLGGVGAWIGCRRRGIPLPPFADAIAPGIAIAQAMGRFGNYFNQELFGRPSDLPWAVEIDLKNRPPGYEAFATYHPTFLYEALWCLGVAAVVIWADRRFRMGHGRAFALYVGLYSVGRAWIESLRIDEAHHFFGIRLNVFTALVVIVGAVVYIVVSSLLRPGRETPDQLGPASTTGVEAADDATDDATDDAGDLDHAVPGARGERGAGSTDDEVTGEPDGAASGTVEP
jgi:prolipoprotein diacylglyceryl transferase